MGTNSVQGGAPQGEAWRIADAYQPGLSSGWDSPVSAKSKQRLESDPQGRSNYEFHPVEVKGGVVEVRFSGWNNDGRAVYKAKGANDATVSIFATSFEQAASRAKKLVLDDKLDPRGTLASISLPGGKNVSDVARDVLKFITNTPEAKAAGFVYNKVRETVNRSTAAETLPSFGGSASRDQVIKAANAKLNEWSKGKIPNVDRLSGYATNDTTANGLKARLNRLLGGGVDPKTQKYSPGNNSIGITDYKQLMSPKARERLKNVVAQSQASAAQAPPPVRTKPTVQEKTAAVTEWNIGGQKVKTQDRGVAGTLVTFADGSKRAYEAKVSTAQQLAELPGVREKVGMVSWPEQIAGGVVSGVEDTARGLVGSVKSVVWDLPQAIGRGTRDVFDATVNRDPVAANRLRYQLDNGDPTVDRSLLNEGLRPDQRFAPPVSRDQLVGQAGQQLAASVFGESAVQKVRDGQIPGAIASGATNLLLQRGNRTPEESQAATTRTRPTVRTEAPSKPVVPTEAAKVMASKPPREAFAEVLKLAEKGQATPKEVNDALRRAQNTFLDPDGRVIKDMKSSPEFRQFRVNQETAGKYISGAAKPGTTAASDTTSEIGPVPPSQSGRRDVVGTSSKPASDLGFDQATGRGERPPGRVAAVQSRVLADMSRLVEKYPTDGRALLDSSRPAAEAESGNIDNPWGLSIGPDGQYRHTPGRESPPSTDNRGGGNGKIPPSVPPKTGGSPQDDDAGQTPESGDSVDPRVSPVSSESTGSIRRATPPTDGTQMTFPSPDRAKVEAFLQDKTGMGIDQFKNWRRRAGDVSGDADPIGLLLRGLSARPSSPGTPVVIEDTFRGRKAVLSIDANGKATMELDTGITNVSNVKGIARLDEGPLQHLVFDSPTLHDTVLNVFWSPANILPTDKLPFPLPGGLGTSELKVLATFPLGTASGVLGPDLRNPLAGLMLLNDVRMSRAKLQAAGEYLSDLKPLKLIAAELAGAADARATVNAFLPLNWADFVLPRLGRNEQRIYVPNTYRAIEAQQGLRITKEGKISLNADQQPDGTWRLKPGTLLTLNVRDNLDARMPWGPQYLLGGVATAIGGPAAGIAATTASQLAMSMISSVQSLAMVQSTGRNVTLTSRDVIPAAIADALNTAFNQPNVFTQFREPAVGTIAHKYARDRPYLFARFEESGQGKLGGFQVPRLKADGTPAARDEAGTSSLTEFWKAAEEKPRLRASADLQARLNAFIATGASAETDARLQLGPARPDNVSKIWRFWPFTVMHLDVRGGGVNTLDRQKRTELLNEPMSAGSARLERPEVSGSRNPKDEPWFKRDLALLQEGLIPGRRVADGPPPRPPVVGIDLDAVSRMQAILSSLPSSDPVFERRQVDLGSTPPGAMRGAATLDNTQPGLFEGADVTTASRAAVMSYLEQTRESLPDDRRADFAVLEQRVQVGLVVGRPADVRALETLDSVRLAIEAANPSSPDQADAARSLVERGAVTALADERRAAWRGVLTDTYQSRVPQWESVITSVTDGVLPPVVGRYGQAIKLMLQNESPDNLAAYHVRAKPSQMIPQDLAERADRPDSELFLDADGLHFFLDTQVKPADRATVIQQSALDRYVYVSGASEGYKFNFRPPRIEQRFGPVAEAFDPYALSSNPGAATVREPKPIERRLSFGDVRAQEIAGVDPLTRELILVPVGSHDKFISHFDLRPHTAPANPFHWAPPPEVAGRLVDYRGDRYRIEHVEAQSNPHGLTLRPVDVRGNALPEAKKVFVPLYGLPEISATIGGQTHHPVGVSWTLVHFQPEVISQKVKLNEGMSFEAFVDDPARGARASGGPVSLEVDASGGLVVTSSTNPTIRAGESFALDKLIPTIATRRSQHTTGEHVPNDDGIVSAGSPVKVRTADILSGTNRASPPPGAIGMNDDAKLTYVKGQQSWDDVARFIGKYRSRKDPSAVIVHNVVYELVSETDNFNTARPILEALKAFHGRHPATPILLYSANSDVAFKLSFKSGTHRPMLEEFARAGIEVRSRPSEGRPQTTHAKSISIVGAEGEPTVTKVVTSGFEPRPRNKADFHLELNPQDSALLANYLRLDALPDNVADPKTRGDLLKFFQGRYPELGLSTDSARTQAGLSAARGRLTADLAANGVLAQDPTGGKSYIQAAYRKLITNDDPGNDVIIAQLREIRMPNLAQMFINEAAKGKKVLIQTSMLDERSNALLKAAEVRLPNLRLEIIGGPSNPSDYAHYNAIITKQGMVVASGYFWSSMMDAGSDPQPSTELGVMLKGGSKPYNDAIESIVKYQRASGSIGFDESMTRSLLVPEAARRLLGSGAEGLP